MGVQENVSERNKLMWEVLYTLHMRRTDRLMNDKVREMLVRGRMAVVYVGIDGVVVVDNGKEEVRGVKEYMGKTIRCVEDKRGWWVEVEGCYGFGMVRERKRDRGVVVMIDE